LLLFREFVMSINVYRIAVIIALTHLFLGSTNAEEILTLDEAIVFAYGNNLRMLEARKGIEAAEGDLITARALPNPEVEFEIGGRETGLNNIGIRQGFDPPGVRDLKSKIAKNEIFIRGESVRIVWSEIYLKVRENYSKIILDKKELELANENLNTLRQFYSRVEIRFQSGKALKNELQRAKIELLEAEINYLAAEKSLEVDKAKLNLLLGRPVDMPFDINEELKEEELELDLKELTNLAFTKRPDIKQEQLNLDSKIKNLAKEQRNRLPSPFVGFDRRTENDSTVTIGISLPLWDLNQGGIKRASAEKEMQQVRVEAVKREAVLDVYEAYLDSEAAHRQFGLLKKSLEEANELLRLADLRYNEGEIDFINFLDQVRTATGTRVKYYTGLFNLNNTISRLEKVIYTSLRKEGYLK